MRRTGVIRITEFGCAENVEEPAVHNCQVESFLGEPSGTLTQMSAHRW